MLLVAFEKPRTWFIRVVTWHTVPADFSSYAKQTAVLRQVS